MSSQTPPSKLPSGFQFSGVACGIKESGKPDLSLIVSDRPVVAVGVYTQNQIVAAPVTLCRSRTPSTSVRAVVTNSGNANACTGEEGQNNAVAMTDFVAKEIQCDPSNVLVMSTGVIGHQLPMEKIQTGIDAAVKGLSSSPAAFNDSAEAILTTDVGPKVACREVSVGDQTYRIAAMAKGAGMIAPNMATMLAVVTTDAPIDEKSAGEILSHATQHSFNRVSVDGHTSTNDTLLMLSSGEGECLDGKNLDTFRDEVTAVCIELAKMLVADGEGATHVMAIRVLGANDDAAALEIAQVVGASPLVKTAITGADPNWGRIVSAAGYAKAAIVPEQTSLKIFDTVIYRDGSPLTFDEAQLSSQMKEAGEVEIELKVGSGPGQTEYWASDLTTDYVSFNSEYTT